MLVSEVSNFVVGSIRPSGRCSKRQVLELACIFASEQCRQGPRAFLHVSPNTKIFLRDVMRSTVSLKHVLCGSSNVL